MSIIKIILGNAKNSLKFDLEQFGLNQPIGNATQKAFTFGF